MLFDLVGSEELNKFTEYFAEKYPMEKENGEMTTKAFVEYFNIPKKDFEKTIQEAIAIHIKLGQDISLELYELPNPDIIYTFDDEIINEYYRRK